MVRIRARRTLENTLRRLGFNRVAGVDEVGRGCLAGPVMAGAVILDPARHIPGLCDSKMLAPGERERLSDLVTRCAAAWSIGVAEADEIDRINIHRATFEAMRRAIFALDPLPDMVLVDRFTIPGLPIPQRGVPNGDTCSASIAAASIVAKVARDRHMMALHARDGRFGFDRHKGYATPEHLAAVARHGCSKEHRHSFRPPSLFDTIDQLDGSADR
ncbi:MAG: ribonuclease HII [Vicinamibacterales bacterium]